MKLENKNLILFDLDGTLIDSGPDLVLAINHMLEKLNKEKFTQEIIHSWVGNGAQTLVKRALLGKSDISEEVDEELFQKSIDIFLDFYANNLTVATVMYPNVKNTLESLHNAGFTLALVTNKPYEFVEPILKSFDIDGLFSLTIGGNSLDVKKPDPKPLLYVLDKLNYNIEQSVMVGDSKNDIEAANRTNMDSIAVTYGYNYNQDIRVFNPTCIIDDFADILDILK
jgi:phosphoglycolate phosphatase